MLCPFPPSLPFYHNYFCVCVCVRACVRACVRVSIQDSDGEEYLQMEVQVNGMEYAPFLVLCKL